MTQEIPIGQAVLRVDWAGRSVVTRFPDGAESWALPNPEDQSPEKIADWGYDGFRDGELQLLAEHEALHSWVPHRVFNLPWSPELWATAHSPHVNEHGHHYLPFSEGIPEVVRPWPEWTVPFEEAVVIATQRWANTEYRSTDWNRAFTNADPLDTVRWWVHNLDTYREDARAFLAQLRR